MNRILEKLLSSVEVSALIIADWQGLPMASKLPDNDRNKEDLIAATTLFSLTGAEDTRKELQNSLLGKKLSYLLVMTEDEGGGTPYIVVCPIGHLGYIACVSNKREDMAILIMNMKEAAREALNILSGSREMQKVEEMTEIVEKVKSIKEQQTQESKYDNILKKIKI